MQGRVRRDERVEIPDHPVYPKESCRPVPIYRKAHHLASIVDGVAARGDRRKGSWKRAKVLHTCCLGPYEGVNCPVGKLRCPDDFSQIIDAASSIEHRIIRITQSPQVPG